MYSSSIRERMKNAGAVELADKISDADFAFAAQQMTERLHTAVDLLRSLIEELLVHSWEVGYE